MGTNIGPDIVQSGLVFGYDSGYGVVDDSTSSRFYLGQPTTNYGPTTFGDWGTEASAQRIATGNYFRSQPTYNCRTTIGASYQGIDTTISGLRTAAGASGTVTMSCMVRNNNSTAYPMYAYIGHDFSSTRTIAANSDWQKVQWTVNQSSMNNDYVEFRPYTNSTHVYLEMTMPMVEVNKGYATQFVVGTRSSTDSLLNLAGSDSGTVGIGNVSFDSNTQPTFDGTDDYINKDRKQYAITENWSVELVFKPTNDSDTSWNGLFGGYLGGGGYWMFHSSGNLTYYEGYDGTSRITYRPWTKANTFNQNVYHHLVITYTSTSSTAGTYNLYYNGGEKTDSFSWTFTFNYSLDSNFIGVGDLSRYGTNDVHVYREYDRVLSAIEIAKNFNAYKNRFGI